jgi:hypothetical protein
VLLVKIQMDTSKYKTRALLLYQWAQWRFCYFLISAHYDV